MLKTVLWVGHDIINDIVINQAPYRMLKDELAFWMGGNGKTVPAHDITISKVRHDMTDFSVFNSAKYEITWHLTFSNGEISETDADQRCVWRNENTFNRYEMTQGLETIFYFANSGEHKIGTNERPSDEKLKERLVSEFELRTSDTTITVVKQNPVYDGREYRVFWTGRFSQEEANKVIEWGNPNN